MKKIQQTVEDPDLVFQSTRHEQAQMFYSLNSEQGNLVGKHLIVVVKYVQEESGKQGYISTIYLSRKIYSKGVLLWQKKQNLLL